MNDELRTSLAVELEERIRRDERWGRRNSVLAQIFVWLAIVASIGGAVVAAWPEFSHKAAAVVMLTSLSAVAATVERSLKFEKRSAWHHLLAAKLKGLLRALRYEGADPAEISRSFSATIEAFEGEWPVMSPPEEKARQDRDAQNG